MSRRKLQRPRLEVSAKSRLIGHVTTANNVLISAESHSGYKSITIKMHEIKRARKFLEKCEAYLKSKRGPRKTKLGQALIGAMKEAQKRGRV